MSTTLQISLTLSDVDMTVLRRYRDDINALVRSGNAVAKELDLDIQSEEWTEEVAISSLLQSALERERRLYQIQDGQSDPPWLELLGRREGK